MPADTPSKKFPGLGVDPLFLATYSEMMDASPISQEEKALLRREALSRKPSVAVLPFDNMSGDTEQSYFSDGITEDIITELSRFRSLLVMARNSSFAFRGEPISVTDVGAKLGVDYVVEGSVRKAGNRVRITAQLIEASTGNHAWAERYDRGLEDIFAVQDEVARIIASTLSSEVGSDIAKRASRKRPESFVAYDYMLKGIQHHQKFTPDDNDVARRLLERAIELDPQYAEAFAWLALTHITTYDPPPQERLTALEHAKRAVELDDTNARSQVILGWCYLLDRQFQSAEHHHLLAMRLNPNDPHVATHMGYLLACTGRVTESYAWFDRAILLNPYPPNWYGEFRGVATFVSKQYAEAIRLLKGVGPLNDYLYLASAYGHLHERSEALQCASRLLELHSDRTIMQIAEQRPVSNHKDMEDLFEGLRKAGLSD